MSKQPPGAGAFHDGDADGTPERPYFARYELDEGGKHWLVHIVSEPGCHSFGTTLQDARRNILDALALWLDLDADDAEAAGNVVLDDVVVPDARLAERVSRLRADQRTIAAASARVANELPALARELHARNWSLRAIGMALGLTHQRISQVLGLKATATPRQVRPAAGRKIATRTPAKPEPKTPQSA